MRAFLARQNGVAAVTRSFRSLLAQPGPILFAGAHNGLSAKLVEQAGFHGVWASGFEISAAHAVPDANILTMSDTLDAAAQMARVVETPILADCDNGFGNAINVIRTVQEYERAGIAAICIEDNIFPKRCSFYAGVKRELASPEEHAGKIRAAIAARRSPDFLICARTEAFIAGWGLDAALERARAYADAGADLILIHSKADTPVELEAFARRWDRSAPLVAVPTIYKSTTATQLHEIGYKVVIFANHALRSAFKAMREALSILHREQRCDAVDKLVVPLDDVYEIVGVPTMKAQEKAFMPAGTDDVRAIILAAGASEHLGPLTADKPVCMLDVKGRSILERQVEVLNQYGIKDISVVRGYKKAAVKLPNIKTYDNDDYASSGELASLFAAREQLRGRVVILYGDVLFDGAVLEKALRSEASIACVVDRSWPEHLGQGAGKGRPDLVRLDAVSPQNARHLNLDSAPQLTQVARGIDPKQADAEFVGLMTLDAKACRAALALWDEMCASSAPFHEARSFRCADISDLLTELLQREQAITAVEIYKGWMDVDSFEAYREVWATTR